MGFCKFIKQYKVVSYDNGVTWEKVTPEENNYRYLSFGLETCECNGECNVTYNVKTDISNVDYNKFLTVDDLIYTYTKTYCDETTKVYLDNSKLTIIYNPNGYNLSSTDRTINASIYKNNGDYINDIQYTQNGTDMSKLLVFSWSGTSSSQTFKINGRTYTASTNPFITTLTDLGINTFTSAKEMFSGKTEITAVTSIPDTSNVTNMSGMFSNCTNLTSLDLSNFDTSNVTDMTFMFYSCSSLTSLDLSSFDVSNVTSMYGMFDNCSGLTSVNLSNWNLYEKVNINLMLYGCENLKTIDLSGWDLSITQNYSQIFYYCTNLTSITVTNCNDITISRLQSELTRAGYSSTVANGIITVTH